jgi:N-methylhydantoinase B/oxoprolinase/acetone carboxylase alpha subunit
LLKANGSQLSLDGMTQIAVEAGDVLTIETPGGGGWGILTADESFADKAIRGAFS